MADKDTFIAWLNDAYAMEQGLIPVLQNHAKDASGMPQIQERIERHIEETKHHAERVEQCIKALGTTPSTVKSWLATLMGSVQGISTGMFRDELVKNALADYGAEQFEVACYKALVAAAEEFGNPEIARLCRENLREDEDMARWLDQQLPIVVRLSLQKTAPGA